MMRDIYRFAGEEAPRPQLSIAPLLDRGIGTATGPGASDLGVRQALYAYIEPELTDSEQVTFVDIPEELTPSMDVLLDRYEDITGGLHPGKPTVKARDVDTDQKLTDFMGLPGDEITAASLERFQQLTKLRPHVAKPAVKSSLEEPPADERSWSGDANKLFARVRLPTRAPLRRSLLHELGHCCMPWVGFTKDVETRVDVDAAAHSVDVNWRLTTSGLSYDAENGERKGSILEEAVAEGLGSLVNRRLRLSACAL